MEATTYTMDDLKQTAKWALRDHYCCEGQHRVTLCNIELHLTNAHASLIITGHCKKHNYTVYTNCAI